MLPKERDSNNDSQPKLIITDRFSLSMIEADCVLAMRTLNLNDAARRVFDALYEEQPAPQVIGALTDICIVELLNATRAFGMSFKRDAGASLALQFDTEYAIRSGDALLVVSRPGRQCGVEEITFRELTVELDERLVLSELAASSDAAQLISH
jgi:hypothetical protein